MVIYIIKYSIKQFYSGKVGRYSSFNLNNNDIVQLAAGFTNTNRITNEIIKLRGCSTSKYVGQHVD